MKLTRDFLGTVLKLSTRDTLEIDSSTFDSGDVVILFNSTNEAIKVVSFIKYSYISGINNSKSFFELPPKALGNFLFVDKDTVVFSGDFK